MGQRLLIRALWRAVRWLARRQFGSASVPRPVLYVGGFAVVAAVAAVVLSRKSEPARDASVL
jgi:hypothetical protein